MQPHIAFSLAFSSAPHSLSLLLSAHAIFSWPHPPQLVAALDEDSRPAWSSRKWARRLGTKLWWPKSRGGGRNWAEAPGIGRARLGTGAAAGIGSEAAGIGRGGGQNRARWPASGAWWAKSGAVRLKSVRGGRNLARDCRNRDHGGQLPFVLGGRLEKIPPYEM
jgi:hypothetical protein